MPGSRWASLCAMRAEDRVASGVAEKRRAARPAGLAARLLPARARRSAAVFAACCLVFVIALGILFAHQTRGNGLDNAVDSWISTRHVPLGVLLAVSRVGGVSATTVLCAVLALGCLAFRRVGGAMLAVLSLVAASAITEWIIKPVVDRTITIHHYVSYPSGHTTGTFALTAALAIVLAGTRRTRPWQAFQVVAVAVAVLVSCAVGAAMIALDFHYFTDTVAGAAVGTGTAIGVAFLLDLEVCRRWLGRVGR